MTQHGYVSQQDHWNDCRECLLSEAIEDRPWIGRRGSSGLLMRQIENVEHWREIAFQSPT